MKIYVGPPGSGNCLQNSCAFIGHTGFESSPTCLSNEQGADSGFESQSASKEVDGVTVNTGLLNKENAMRNMNLSRLTKELIDPWTHYGGNHETMARREAHR